MASSGAEELLSHVKELEALLQFPDADDNIEKAAALANLIARQAGGSAVADLAHKVIRETNAAGPAALGAAPSRTRLNKVLWHLRLAIEEANRRK